MGWVCDKMKNIMGWRTRTDKLLDTYYCLALRVNGNWHVN